MNKPTETPIELLERLSKLAIAHAHTLEEMLELYDRAVDRVAEDVEECVDEDTLEFFVESSSMFFVLNGRSKIVLSSNYLEIIEGLTNYLREWLEGERYKEFRIDDDNKFSSDHGFSALGFFNRMHGWFYLSKQDVCHIQNLLLPIWRKYYSIELGRVKSEGSDAVKPTIERIEFDRNEDNHFGAYIRVHLSDGTEDIVLLATEADIGRSAIFLYQAFESWLDSDSRFSPITMNGCRFEAVSGRKALLFSSIHGVFKLDESGIRELMTKLKNLGIRFFAL